MHSSMDQANKNFEKYQGLSVYYSRKYFKLCRGFGYSDEEVITWGFEALWKICLNMKETSEGEFKTYLSMRIRGEIIDNIRKDKLMFGSKIGLIKMYTFSNVSPDSSIEHIRESIDMIYMSPIIDFKSIEDEEFYNYITEGLCERSSFIIRQRIFLDVNMNNISRMLNISPQTASRIWNRDIVPKVKTKLHRLIA